MINQKSVRHQLVHIGMMETLAALFVAQDDYRVSEWNCYLLYRDCCSSFGYTAVLFDGVFSEAHAFVLANYNKIVVLCHIDRLV